MVSSRSSDLKCKSRVARQRGELIAQSLLHDADDADDDDDNSDADGDE